MKAVPPVWCAGHLGGWGRAGVAQRSLTQMARLQTPRPCPEGLREGPGLSSRSEHTVGGGGQKPPITGGGGEHASLGFALPRTVVTVTGIHSWAQKPSVWDLELITGSKPSNYPTTLHCTCINSIKTNISSKLQVFKPALLFPLLLFLVCFVLFPNIVGT